MDRRQSFVKGLGALEVLQIDPVPDVDFVDVGFLKETKFNDVYDMEDVTDERGLPIDFLPKGQKVFITTSLMQSSKAQFDILRNAKTQLHAVRYFGRETANYFKYFALENARIVPTIVAEYKPGLRTIPVSIYSLLQQELAFDVPIYYIIETRGVMHLVGLNAWLSPRQGLNVGTAKLLDASGYARHATLSPSGDLATIWQGDGTGSPGYFLRLDGTDDQADLGDVLDVDDVSDFAFEFWVRIQGADASLQEIYGKKADDADTAGTRLTRTAANKIEFKISDGTNSATVITASTVLQNVWKLVALAVDRNGNGQLYLNGVADGSAASVAGVTATAANALDFIVGKFNGNFGQIDVGDVRWFRYGAGNLPASIGTFFADHFAAERGYYGV